MGTVKEEVTEERGIQLKVPFFLENGSQFRALWSSGHENPSFFHPNGDKQGSHAPKRNQKQHSILSRLMLVVVAWFSPFFGSYSPLATIAHYYSAASHGISSWPACHETRDPTRK